MAEMKSYSHWGMFVLPDDELARLRSVIRRINQITLANSSDG
jgi:hypothetical protein